MVRVESEEVVHRMRVWCRRSRGSQTCRWLKRQAVVVQLGFQVSQTSGFRIEGGVYRKWRRHYCNLMKCQIKKQLTNRLFFFSCFSPAEELSFGSGETEKRCLIILNNITRDQVAFKVTRPCVRTCRGVRRTLLFYPLTRYFVDMCVIRSQVRTTAPEKYRVKPSSSSCEPGANVDIIVSLHGGTIHRHTCVYSRLFIVM